MCKFIIILPTGFSASTTSLAASGSVLRSLQYTYARSLKSGLSVSYVAHDSTAEIIFWGPSVGIFRNSLTVADNNYS